MRTTEVEINSELKSNAGKGRENNQTEKIEDLVLSINDKDKSIKDLKKLNGEQELKIKEAKEKSNE